jgi:hypothetical protein
VTNIDQHSRGGASQSDIWSALNQGVQALNNLARQFATAKAAFASFMTTTAPITVITTTYTQGATDTSLIFNGTATATVTLLSAVTYPGRVTYVKTTTNFALNSASANIVPLAGGAAGSSILAATAGKWATLQSDGVNWIIMAAN